MAAKNNSDETPVILERVFDAPVAAVWQALTDIKAIRQWYFQLEEFRPEVGFRFQFTAGKDGKAFVHLCEIVTVVPEKKIAYTWKYENHPGESLVSFELSAEGQRTKLKLTHTGLHTFQGDKYPDFAKSNFIAGWTHIIGTSLADFLAKNRAAA